MHSNAHFMFGKLATTVPFGIGGIPVYAASRLAYRVQKPRVYNLKILINSLNY